jgi:hypothetical protein
MLEQLETVVSDAAADAEAATPGAGGDALVWEELEGRARDDAALTASFLVFMIIAAAIAASVALASCNSQSTAQDTLDPNAITAPDANAGSQPGGASMPGGPPTTGTPGRVGAPIASGAASPQGAGIAANTRIHFAPIVGTSVDAASSLSTQLLSRASERGIQTVGDADPAVTHLLKGYFTPLVEGKETTVIYVWDVYDPSGNRIHRISGQQKAPSKGGEGWAAVPPATASAPSAAKARFSGPRTREGTPTVWNIPTPSTSRIPASSAHLRSDSSATV